MISIYNSLSKKVEEFKPIKPGEVSMYSCGPTVYDTVHIGNLRTSILNDVLAKSFRYLGYKVNSAMNITDVDDKTLRKSLTNNEELGQLTRKYEELFFADFQKLNLERPSKVLRATENIDGMIEIISKLLENGHAYKADDGVYFKVDSFPKYSELVGASRFTGAKQNRIANDEYDKENASDFALWKFYKPETDGQTFWETPFGKGRPGWHIECSAMSRSALGQPFDIHTGGLDLLFPHHTNEIAQSECAYDERLANFWIHGGMLNVDDSKMAKSKNNFYKLENLIEKGIDPLAFKYLTFGTHYRSPMNFTWEALMGAENALKNLRAHVAKLSNLDASDVGEGARKNEDVSEGKIIESIKEKFISELESDLNIPRALATLHELLKSTEKPEDIRATVLDFDKVFGLELNRASRDKEEIPEEIIRLAEERQTARANKDWTKSDEIRDRIAELGYKVLDNKDGYKIEKA